MSRLIDNDLIRRKDAIDAMAESYEDTDAEWILQKLPTVDAVPVVRCKDCKFFREHLSMNCVYHVSAVGENWFCSQGRKVTE